MIRRGTETGQMNGFFKLSLTTEAGSAEYTFWTSDGGTTVSVNKIPTRAEYDALNSKLYTNDVATSSDLNDIKDTCMRFCNGVSHSPRGDELDFGHLIVIPRDDKSSVVQMWLSGSNRLYLRRYSSNAWGSWVQIGNN